MTRRNCLALSLFLFWMCSEKSFAGIVTAASCLQADVTVAISIATNGDTVNVPGGCTVAWSSLTIPSTKGITLAGGSGGGTTTISSSAAIIVNSSATTTTRITGFTFTSLGTDKDGDIHVIGSTSSAAYRIDHDTFANTAQSVFLILEGNGPGLIDHNTFTGGGASEEIHNVALGPSSNAGWTDDVAPGSAAMVFIEDNRFNCNDPTFLCSAVQSYYGARTVIRHNSVNFSQFDQHGTAGSIGARWYEIYSNSFNAQNKQQCCYFDIRGGSGVIYSNTVVSGSNQVAGSLTLREEDTGAWPLAYQVGSGINGQTDQHSTCTAASRGTTGVTNSNPVYIWSNDAAMSIDTSQSPLLVQANRDFFVSTSQPASLVRQEANGDTCATTYSYTPYPYPHPLQQAGGTAPSVPGTPVATPR